MTTFDNTLEKNVTKSDVVGIKEIHYVEGDFREEPGYYVTFFRNDKTYIEWIKPESGEVLMDLLNISIDNHINNR
jgi:hypothetical protein